MPLLLAFLAALAAFMLPDVFSDLERAVIALLLILTLLLRTFTPRQRLRRALARVHKLDGRQFEDLLADIYRHRGYQVTKVSDGKDYGADLLIKKGRKTTAVQAKHYGSRNVGNEAIQQIIAGAAYYEADQAAVVTTATFTPSALKQAEKSPIPVELIDSEALKGWL